jgi:hypothetical protein
MIVEIKMIFIGTTKITPKNRSEPVFFGCVDRKRPVLGGPVRSPQYLCWSWTGCGPRLRVLGEKNRTEPDLKTLFIVGGTGAVGVSPPSDPCLAVFLIFSKGGSAHDTTWKYMHEQFFGVAALFKAFAHFCRTAIGTSSTESESLPSSPASGLLYISCVCDLIIIVAVRVTVGSAIQLFFLSQGS